jgi:hypothetical protein
VRVGTGTNQLPLQADVPMQTVIRDWERVPQSKALNDALRDLGLLRMHTAQEYLGLVQEYQQALRTYLDQRDRSGAVLPFIRQRSRRRAAEAAIQQLNALDVRRQTFRPTAKAPNTNQPPPAPAAPPT